MQTRCLAFGAAISLTLACGSNPAAPTAGAGLRIAADAVIDLLPGESRALAVEPRDASGLTWTTSDPAIATVEAGLLRAGQQPGAVTITVMSASGATAVAHAVVQLPQHVPSTYRITLVYSDEIPDSWKPAFQWAANRWQDVIRASLAPVDMASLPVRVKCPGLPDAMYTGLEHGTRIFVGRIDARFGSGGGPCAQRPGPRLTTAIGRVDVSYSTRGEDPERLNGAFTLHEIGHVLGLVGVFDRDATPSWFDYEKQIFRGPFGLEGHRRDTGARAGSLEAQGGHWHGLSDVMAVMNSSVTISRASVGVLMDLGYPAAWYGGGF